MVDLQGHSEEPQLDAQTESEIPGTENNSGTASRVDHASLSGTRKLADVAVGLKKEGMLFFGIESGAALLVSLFINICVVTVFAKGFYGGDIGDIGLENAGKYLGDRFGSSMVRYGQ